MARKVGSRPLDSGDTFPALGVDLVDGRRLVLPTQLSRPFNVVLINRGAWCPFCVGQLKGFQAGLPKLAEEDIGVISISADPLESALSMTETHKLTFPVAYGASVDAVSDALGGFFSEKTSEAAAYLQSAGFVLGPGAKILTSVYSSGAIGRLVWQDVLGLVQYVKAHA